MRFAGVRQPAPSPAKPHFARLGQATIGERSEELKCDLVTRGFRQRPCDAPESALLAVLFTFNSLGVQRGVKTGHGGRMRNQPL
jgi:hypothetical protein